MCWQERSLGPRVTPHALGEREGEREIYIRLSLHTSLLIELQEFHSKRSGFPPPPPSPLSPHTLTGWRCVESEGQLLLAPVNLKSRGRSSYGGDDRAMSTPARCLDWNQCRLVHVLNNVERLPVLVCVHCLYQRNTRSTGSSPYLSHRGQRGHCRGR